MVPLAAPEAFGAGGGVDFLRSGHGASGFSFDALGDGVAAYLARLHTCLLHYSRLSDCSLQLPAVSFQILRCQNTPIFVPGSVRGNRRSESPIAEPKKGSADHEWPAPPYIVCPKRERLDGVLASLSCADADDLVNKANENLAIADLVGARRADYSVADRVDTRFLDDHLQLIITDHADITDVGTFKAQYK